MNYTVQDLWYSFNILCDDKHTKNKIYKKSRVNSKIK